MKNKLDQQKERVKSPDEYIKKSNYSLGYETYTEKKDIHPKDLNWDDKIRKILTNKNIDALDVWNSLRIYETINEHQEINWHYLLGISDEDIRIFLYNIQYRRPNSWYRIQKRIEKQQRFPKGRFDLYQQQTGFSDMVHIYRTSSDPIN